MKFSSIKWKITLWYTVIVILVFGTVVAGMLLYSEFYGEDKVKVELEDEIKDLKEDIIRYTDYFPQDEIISYYDDGVMLSIYDEKLNMVNGIIPDEFPENIEFKEREIQKIKSTEESWFVSDTKVTIEEKTVWIRGIHSYSSLMIMIDKMIFLMSIIFPILAVITAYVGYRMIRRSLMPMQTIVETANEITQSGNLSRRITLGKSKDEFYLLSNTFNQMFEKLEENFYRERQFSSDAAHELRTPLSVILSHCEYCLDELDLDDKVRDEVSSVKRKALQMSEMVAGLLAISREEKKLVNPDLEEIDLTIVAESVAEELEEKADRKNISISVVNTLKNSYMIGDLSMITRMFINLVDNAINYGKENGFVKIILGENSNNIIIKISDNGIGISKSSQKEIWNRFYQVDESHTQEKGFGLGLYLVKQIVNCHNGSIDVDSQLNKGTTFSIKLPKKI